MTGVRGCASFFSRSVCGGGGWWFARIGRGGTFSTTTRIPDGRRPARYGVTARCGGGNLGVSAALTVFILPVLTG